MSPLILTNKLSGRVLFSKLAACLSKSAENFFDNSKRFHYGGCMAEYTLKNIPAEIYHRAQSAAENSFRSLNQEIIYRLRRSFDAEDARTTALHAKWVMEALESGATKPLKMQDLDAAFGRGTKRAAARRPRK
ncbi:MAG TPA: hypothetical protein VFC85_07030 [Verrucomicrobiae bacterium]|nr:hypothetical protein [Verrucomicrobiae bacterium]